MKKSVLAHTRWGWFIFFLAAASAGMIAMWWITARGCGLSPDSLIYIETGKSLIAGQGFTHVAGAPLTQYPPAYSILLAGMGLLQPNMLYATRLLNAMLFGVNIVLIGILIRLCTQGNALATICAVFSVCSAPVILIHMMAMSDSLFVAFSLTAFILLSLHIAHPHLGLLFGASAAIALTMLTRYVGVTLLPPALCVILLLDSQSIRRRLSDAVLLVFVSCAPLTAWLIHNTMTAQSSTNRSMAIHLIGIQHIKELIRTLSRFLFPTIPGWIGVLMLLGIAIFLSAGIVGLYRKGYFQRNASSIIFILPALCLSFSLTYLLFLIFSVSFIDAYTPFDHRLLWPCFLFFILASISLVWSMRQELSSYWVWRAFIIFLLISIAFNGPQAVSQAIELHKNSQGFSSPPWIESRMIARVKSMSMEQDIYSNGADVLQFWTGRRIQWIPIVWNPMTLKPNPDCQHQMQTIIQQTNAGTAVVAYFDTIYWRSHLPAKDEIHLPVLEKFDDGAIYGSRLILAKGVK